MIKINTKSGGFIIKSTVKDLKSLVQYAVLKNISLKDADLSGANLKSTNMPLKYKIAKIFKYFVLLGLLGLFLLVLTHCNANAALKKNEAYYQEILCNDLDGIIEYRLPDRSRVDCLTYEYAIEVDFDKKPYECAAQALYYAIMTNRKPACAFITDKKQSRQISRLEVLAKAYNIKIIYIER